MTKRIRVAVTGAGGGVGLSIIKALQETEYEVVALDGNHLGTGLYAARRSHIIPGSRDVGFSDAVLDICRRESCQILFPGLDSELESFANSVNLFKEVGTTIVVSNPSVVEACNNKLITHDVLKRAGVSVPDTIDLAASKHEDRQLPDYPFVLKKREGGSRSKDVYRIDSDQDLLILQTEGIDFSDYIAQDYIEGEEYTCGSVTLAGKCHGVIAMRRMLRGGDTYKCFSVRSQVVEEEARKAVDAIKPFGACNVQLRLRGDKAYVFEINARCSGTTAARALCGFNEPKMIADYICHGVMPRYTIEEQTVFRYWQELVVPNSLVERAERFGTVVQDLRFAAL